MEPFLLDVPIQTAREMHEHILAYPGVRKDLLEVAHQALVLIAVLHERDERYAGRKRDTVVRHAVPEGQRLQVVDAVLETQQMAPAVQLLFKLVDKEHRHALLHHVLLEGRVFEKERDLVELLADLDVLTLLRVIGGRSRLLVEPRRDVGKLLAHLHRDTHRQRHAFLARMPPVRSKLVPKAVLDRSAHELAPVHRVNDARHIVVRPGVRFLDVRKHVVPDDLLVSLRIVFRCPHLESGDSQSSVDSHLFPQLRALALHKLIAVLAELNPLVEKSVVDVPQAPPEPYPRVVRVRPFLVQHIDQLLHQQQVLRHISHDIGSLVGDEERVAARNAGRPPRGPLNPLGHLPLLRVADKVRLD